MRINQIIFFLLLPLCALADGIRYTEYTLDAVRFAFLVKVILYDVKKNTAKVEILKKYQKSNSLEKNPQNTEVKDLKTGDTTTISMKPPKAFVPGRWVSATRYWDEATTEQQQAKAFVVYNSEKQFEFTDYSPSKEKKFDLFYDDEKLQRTLNSSTLDDLLKLLEDRDFEFQVAAELTKRNAIDPQFLVKISGRDTLHRLLHFKLEKTNAPERESFLILSGKEFSQASSQKQEQFLQTFANFTSVSLDTKVTVYESFKLEKQEIRHKISVFLSEVKKLFETKKDPHLLQKIKQIYLEFLKNSGNESSAFRIEDFFDYLPEIERSKFIEDATRAFVVHFQRGNESPQLDTLVDKIATTKHAAAAWILTEISLQDFHSSRKEKLFNAILTVLFNSETSDSLALKNKILNYANPYLMHARYPISLSPENKSDYLKIGGLVIEDLDSLRLSQQSNLTELANKFTYYFETALVVEIVKTESLPNSRNLVHLKIHKKFGELKDKEIAQRYKNILNICEKSIPGETLTLAIDNDSLEIVTKLNIKKMILATKSGNYQFLIFDTSFENKIESSFK